MDSVGPFVWEGAVLREWGASSAVLKVTVMRMPNAFERRLFRLIKSAVEHACVQGIKFISVSDRPIFFLAYRRIGLSQNTHIVRSLIFTY